MKKNKKVTKEQREYIAAHINKRPRTEVAKAAGVSMYAMYKIVREFGGELRKDMSTPNLKARDIVIKEYPTMSSGEIAEKYSLQKSLVIRWAAKLKLKHTPETIERLRQKRVYARNKSLTPEVLRSMRDKRERTRRMEEFRVMSGLPQKTKLKIAVIPQRTRKAIWYLSSRYNYFVDKSVGGLYTVYYDVKTNRTPLEHLYVQRYGLKFQQA